MNEQKVSHFRTWKSGKKWIYAGAVITALSIGGLVSNFIPGNQSVLIAHADTVGQTATITYWATDTTKTSYSAWVWNADGSGKWVVLNAVGNGAYTGTFTTGDGDTALDIIITPESDWNAGQSPTISTTIATSGNSQVAINQNYSAYAVTTTPTLSAPTDNPISGTIGTPVQVDTTPAITDPNKMGIGTVTSVTVSGPSTSSIQEQNITADGTFTPDVAGQYTITYNYGYTNLDTTTSTTSATTTINVTGDIVNTITTGTAPLVTEQNTVDLSAVATGTTDSNADVTPDIRSVVFTPTGSTTSQTIAVISGTTYKFPSVGTYTVTYEDATGATSTLTGTVEPAPSYFTSTGASDTATVGDSLDVTSYQTLINPDNTAVSINDATITVTGPDDSSSYSESQTLDVADGQTIFTPDVAGTYTINYSYVDATSTTQKSQEVITVNDAPTLNIDDNFQSQQNINADESGKAVFNPITQGVTVTDASNSNPTPTVIITDNNDSTYTPLIPNTDGTYTLTTNGNTMESYTVEYSYDGLDNTVWQTINVLQNGLSVPVITVNSSRTVNVNSLVSDTQNLSITDSSGNQVSIPDALADGSLIISVYDSAGNPVDVDSVGNFIPDLIGNYTVYFDYTDTNTAMSATEVIEQVVVNPKVTAPADITEKLTGSGSRLIFTPDPTEVTVDDPQNTDTSDPDYDYGSVSLGDAEGENIITISSDNTDDNASVIDNGEGTYSLTAGTYTVTYTYTAYDPNNPWQPVTVTVTQNITVLPMNDSTGGGSDSSIGGSTGGSSNSSTGKNTTSTTQRGQVISQNGSIVTVTGTGANRGIILKVQNLTIPVGAPWSAIKSWIVGTDSGSRISFSQLKIIYNDVNTKVPGIYHITFCYGDPVQITATVTVKGKPTSLRSLSNNSISTKINNENNKLPITGQKTQNILTIVGIFATVFAAILAYFENHRKKDILN